MLLVFLGRRCLIWMLLDFTGPTWFLGLPPPLLLPASSPLLSAVIWSQMEIFSLCEGLLCLVTWYISHSMVTPPKTEVTVPDKTFPAPWWSQNHTRVKCDEIMIWTWATSFAISLFTFSPKIEPTASSPAIIVCKVKVKFLLCNSFAFSSISRS